LSSDPDDWTSGITDSRNQGRGSNPTPAEVLALQAPVAEARVSAQVTHHDPLGDGTMHEQDPEPQPIPLTPELREWILKQFDEDMALAELQELEENGGLKLDEFVMELEQIVEG
jgi:hypothetical protein